MRRNELIIIIKHLANPDYPREKVLDELMEFFNKYFYDRWDNE